MAREMPGRGDWALLPPELLPLIYKKLPDLADFVRFRAVCKRWQSAAPASDPPPQLPWLLGRAGTALQADLQFHSLSSGRTYRVRALGGRSCLHASGACHGYILCIDLSSTVLYNPVDGTRLALPPPSYPPWLYGVIHVTGGDDCVVVNTCLPTRRFGYCRPGDTQWKLIDGHPDMRHHAYYNGKFYVNKAAGDTLVIDAETLAVESMVLPPAKPVKGYPDYMVESSGTILRVVLAKRERDSKRPVSTDDYRFNVYRLELRPEKSAWVRVESIGECALFFDDHGHGFSFASNESAGLRRDCIYFVHETRTWVDAGAYRFLCRYSLEDGVVDKVVPLPHMFGDTWVVPSLCSSL